MKPIIIRGLILLVVTTSGGALYAQNTIQYGYDASGNRTSRTILLPSAPKSQVPEQQNMPAYTDLFAGLNISIYPNPTKGQLTVQIDGLQPEQTVDILVYSLSGSLLLKKTKVGAVTDIDIGSRPAGTYVMKIVSGENTTEWKIIKE
ncbi:MAG: T9SS type A sorting domain-containing protein [Candidatus Azobacteroides sp.]|nr:T9SS type A sorting domain-containing protein [Candidatus Azobacteroides sp.]